MTLDVAVRDLQRADLPALARIDKLHTGRAKRAYWEAMFARFLDPGSVPLRIGLGAQRGARLAGYLLGEVRAFEFGSEECGWIFAVGVDPRAARTGVGSRLLAEACARFRDGGMPCVRTMVRRNDVPVLSFFRGNGFRGGPFVQLELAVTAVSEAGEERSAISQSSRRSGTRPTATSRGEPRRRM